MRLTWPISSLREAKLSSGNERDRWFFAFTFSRVGKKKKKKKEDLSILSSLSLPPPPLSPLPQKKNLLVKEGSRRSTGGSEQRCAGES